MKLEEHGFFQGFTGSAGERLRAATETVTHANGVLLFSEGDPSDCVYLVLEGEVELLKDAAIGHTVSIARIGRDDYFGDMGVIDDCPRSTGARTVGDTALGRIPAEELMTVLRTENIEVSLGFFRELSKRLRASNARFVHQVLHKEKMTLVGEMAGSIVHDFKNTMAGVHGMAELILMKCGEEESVKKYCGVIQEEVEHMNAMALDLLDFARGRSSLVREIVPVRELLEKIERLNADTMKLCGIGFEVAMPPGDLSVLVDRTRFLRVLQNLISNALQVLHPAGKGTVSLSAEAEGDALVVRIADDGPGIPEDIRSTIFEPFVTAGKRTGAGLGMAIVKRIVEAHEGSVDFETETNRGTTFRIRLPLADRG